MKNHFPPKDKSYTYLQTNRSNNLGSLWSTMGLDFQSNLATMRVAPRLRISTSTSNDADLGNPVAFSYQAGTFWAVCGSVVFFNTDNANTVWTQDASTNTPSNCDSTSDLEIFSGKLWLTTANTLWSKTTSGGTWTNRDTINTARQHCMTFFQNVPGGRLYYVGAEGNIWSIDSAFAVADTGDYSILIPNAIITCMTATTNSIWMGFNVNDSTVINPYTLVGQWDGISAQLTNVYIIKGASAVQSIVIMNDTPYVMDSNGILSKFTGYSFEEVGRLPFTTILPNTDYMCKNGMIVTKNNTILVNIDNQNVDNAGSIYENIPSGIWEWSEEFGFTHKYPFTYNTNAAPSTITDYGQNRISTVGALFESTNFENTQSDANGQLLAGCTYFTDASSTSSAIFFDDTNNTIQKKGYFVTTWFNSNEVQDKWERLWLMYRRFLASTDSIVMKYRLTEEDPTYANITWVNTTSFTTTTDLSAYAPTVTGSTGGEIEVIQGTGSASCAHITGITGAGTFTVTLDTAITGVTTGTAKVRAQKWIKLNPAKPQNQVVSYSQMQIGQSNIRIQFKGCMTFTGNDEFLGMASFSNSDITITA